MDSGDYFLMWVFTSLVISNIVTVALPLKTAALSLASALMFRALVLLRIVLKTVFLDVIPKRLGQRPRDRGREGWNRRRLWPALPALIITGSIILVSALSSLLYHYGVLQLIVKAAAWVMRRVMRTSGSETLAAAANIFMGQTEAPLVVKPYLARMTRSELMALMVPGMATIAGGVLAAYVSFGISAGHLLTASVMSAPAALMMAKILLPETEVSETAHGAHQPIDARPPTASTRSATARATA
jgi:hypothetical protein